MGMKQLLLFGLSALAIAACVVAPSPAATGAPTARPPASWRAAAAKASFLVQGGTSPYTMDGASLSALVDAFEAADCPGLLGIGRLHGVAVAIAERRSADVAKHMSGIEQMRLDGDVTKFVNSIRSK